VNKTSIHIKSQDHFKLYILLQNKMSLESELMNQYIDFYYNIDEQSFGNEIRYFILSTDREKVDAILLKNEIIGTLEQNLVKDFKYGRKLIKFEYKAYLIIVIVFIAITLLALIIEKAIGD
jgi:hypothetical protein